MDLLISSERLNQTGAEFLKIDVEMALTFTDIARRATDPLRKQRNRRAARRAYDSIVRLTARVHLSDEDARTLRQGLTRLKSELKSLGESF